MNGTRQPRNRAVRKRGTVWSLGPRNVRPANVGVVAGRRYYSPGLGRWTSRDPIGEKGGTNVLAFTGNAPLGRWDYIGLSSSCCERSAAERAAASTTAGSYRVCCYATMFSLTHCHVQYGPCAKVSKTGMAITEHPPCRDVLARTRVCHAWRRDSCTAYPLWATEGGAHDSGTTVIFKQSFLSGLLVCEQRSRMLLALYSNLV